MIKEQFAEAQKLYKAGFLPIPILPTGCKAPAIKWGEIKNSGERPPEDVVLPWFEKWERGMAVLGGKCSNGFEQLDFDSHHGHASLFPLWWQEIPSEWQSCLVVYETPSGGHKVCWCCKHHADNAGEVLAWHGPGDPAIELLCNKPLMCPGGSAKAHPLGLPYKYWNKGRHLMLTPKFTVETREFFIRKAKALTNWTAPPKPIIRPVVNTDDDEYGWQGDSEDTPWGDFNLRTSWAEVLEPHGWELVGREGDILHWRRPGKFARVVSATTNAYGVDKLYCWSASTSFVQHQSYRKNIAWSILNGYGCDPEGLSRAGKKLAHLGYGWANRPMDWTKLKLFMQG